MRNETNSELIREAAALHWAEARAEGGLKQNAHNYKHTFHLYEMSLNAPHSIPPTPYQSIEKPPAPLFPLFRFIFFLRVARHPDRFRDTISPRPLGLMPSNHVSLSHAMIDLLCSHFSRTNQWRLR